MKIVITSKKASWWRFRLSLLPSLDLQYATGLKDNLEKGIVQRVLEIDVYFSFLFFNAYIETLTIWGNEGKIEDVDCVTYSISDFDTEECD
jgi:hypothetical protein